MSTRTLTFTFPSEPMAEAVIHELSEHYGYPATVSAPVLDAAGADTGTLEPIPNPQTRDEFVAQSVALYLGGIAENRLGNAQAAAAQVERRAQFSMVKFGIS